MVCFGKGCSGGVEERRGGDQFDRRDDIAAAAATATAATIRRVRIGIGRAFHVIPCRECVVASYYGDDNECEVGTLSLSCPRFCLWECVCTVLFLCVSYVVE